MRNFQITGYDNDFKYLLCKDFEAFINFDIYEISIFYDIINFLFINDGDEKYKSLVISKLRYIDKYSDTIIVLSDYSF